MKNKLSKTLVIQIVTTIMILGCIGCLVYNIITWHYIAELNKQTDEYNRDTLKTIEQINQLNKETEMNIENANRLNRETEQILKNKRAGIK